MASVLAWESYALTTPPRCLDDDLEVSRFRNFIYLKIRHRGPLGRAVGPCTSREEFVFIEGNV
jgi:hypothetical protein